MHPLVLWLVGVVLLLLESVAAQVFGLESLTPQIWIALTAWLGLNGKLSPSALTLAALLPFMTLTSGAPSSIWVPGVVVSFLALRPTNLKIQALSPFTHAALGLVVCLIHALVMALVLVVFSPGSRILSSIAWNVIWAAPVAGICAAGVFFLLRKIEGLFGPRQSGLRFS